MLLSLSNGKAVNPFQFVPAKDFDPKVVAKSLAHICRYNGHHGWMSVAEHSLIVANIMGFRWDAHPAEELRSEWRLLGLLHDATESLFGDITSPVKSNPQFDQLRRQENEYLGQIFAMHRIFPTREILDHIHAADRHAMSVELEYLGQHRNPYWETHMYLYPRHKYPMVVAFGLERDEAEETWLRMYNELVRF